MPDMHAVSWSVANAEASVRQLNKCEALVLWDPHHPAVSQLFTLQSIFAERIEHEIFSESSKIGGQSPPSSALCFFLCSVIFGVFFPCGFGARERRDVAELQGFHLNKLPGFQLSHEKNLPTFHSTGWFIGILVIAYYNHYITWVGFHPLYILTNQDFFSLLSW